MTRMDMAGIMAAGEPEDRRRSCPSDRSGRGLRSRPGTGRRRSPSTPRTRDRRRELRASPTDRRERTLRRRRSARRARPSRCSRAPPARVVTAPSTQRERELLIAPAATAAPHVHRRLAAGHDTRRTLESSRAVEKRLRRVARLADRRGLLNERVIPELARGVRRGAHRIVPRRHDEIGRARRDVDPMDGTGPSIKPAAPASRCATTAGGRSDSTSCRRSTSIASANVESSPVVGPDPITTGSSSTGTHTSEMASVTERPARAASWPPLIADRCRRTRFSSPMFNPASKQTAGHRGLVGKRQTWRRHRHHRGRAAGQTDEQQRVLALRRVGQLQRGATGGFAGLGRLRMCRRETSPDAGVARRRRRSSRPHPARDRCASSTARAMPTAAFPTATARMLRSRRSESATASRPLAVARRASTAEIAAETIDERCCRACELVNLMGLGPGRKLGDDVDPAKKLADHLAGIVALTERVEVGEQELERVFGLGNGDVRVVLPLTFQASMMFE